jgi:uncharacterized Ntn-hydrolase superfamily protein
MRAAARVVPHLTVSTFSIAACDPRARQWGVAVASKFLAVGSLVPWAAAGAGAIATQAYGNPRYGSEGLVLLQAGLGAAEVLERLIAGDADRDERQVGIVDGAGQTAAFTGSGCHAWAGHRTGAGYAAQGNLLAGPAVVDALAETFAATAGRLLAERLLDCLAAAQAAGGDRRGQQSSALVVVEAGGGYAGLWDRLVDLRVDDHPAPIAELARLYRSHVRLFGRTPRADWLAVDGALAAELAERLARAGFAGPLAEALRAWAGVENLEERVDGAERIDPVVLEELRRG